MIVESQNLKAQIRLLKWKLRGKAFGTALRTTCDVTVYAWAIGQILKNTTTTFWMLTWGVFVFTYLYTMSELKQKSFKSYFKRQDGE